MISNTYKLSQAGHWGMGRNARGTDLRHSECQRRERIKAERELLSLSSDHVGVEALLSGTETR